jgi:uncharacterized repeat protein (TIGR04052 family)
MSLRTSVLSSCVLVLAIAAACGTQPTPQPTAITLAFKPVDADGKRFACGAQDLALAGLTNARPGDLRLYVHDVKLLKAGKALEVAVADDGVWQKDGLVLLDFEDRSAECSIVVFGKATTTETNTVIKGTVAEAGPYDGVQFTVGVPFSKTYLPLDSAPSPLNSAGMDHGSDGRQHFRLVFYTPTTTGDGGTFQNFHNLVMYRSVCDAVTVDGGVPASESDCAKPNRPVIRIDGAFDVATQAVLFDVSKLLAGYPTPGSGPSPKLSSDGRIDCFGPLHARDLGPQVGAERCGTFYPNLGVSYATGTGAGMQTVFRFGTP